MFDFDEIEADVEKQGANVWQEAPSSIVEEIVAWNERHVQQMKTDVGKIKSMPDAELEKLGSRLEAALAKFDCTCVQNEIASALWNQSSIPSRMPKIINDLMSLLLKLASAE